MNRAAVAAVAVGLSLVGAQGAAVASAAPGEGGTASVSAGPASANANGRPAARRAPARISTALKPVAAQRESGPSARRNTRPVAKAAAVSSRPIVSLLFNRTPTMSPSVGSPGIDGVIRGALNAADADSNTLTYTVTRQPAKGQVTIAGDGSFTYVPATPGDMSAAGTFDVSVTDAGHGIHLHGLWGLVNLLTFGLIGSSGHTATRTLSLDVPPPAELDAYLEPVAPGVIIKPILTVGDSPTGVTYPMVGAPDGLGLYDNNDGTFTLLMNHELSAGSGAVRAHGANGAFVSRFVIDKSTLEVLDGSDLIQRVFGWNAATQTSDTSPSVVSFSRFCSADLAAPSAYSYNGLGTTARIFLNGQEGGSGIALATVATGPSAGDSYVLGRFSPGTNGSGLSGTPSWENLLASPFAQEKTVVIGNNDGGSGVMSGALAVYVGTKQSTGTDIDRAGLTNGALKFVTVSGNAAEIVNSSTRATNIRSGTAFTLSPTASTSFSRPEDGAWNPLNPNEYYFVTTDRLDQAGDGVGSQVGQSRLWRLNFTDITNPELGGTIDLLIDGDTVGGSKVNMLDNLTIDRSGRILIQEDTGGAAHNAKIWQYDIATDSLTLLARHDPDRFGDIGLPATAPFTTDEESSGIVDAEDVLGPGWFLATVMAHYPLGGALVQGGQLVALRI